MAGKNDVKARIASVKSTRQITKAMNLVSTIKYKKARVSTEHIRPYVDEFRLVVENMYNYKIERAKSQLTENRTVKKSLAVVISSDRGLCAAYNSSIIKYAAADVSGKNCAFMTIGAIARDYFKKNGYELMGSYENITDTVVYHNARVIALNIMKMYRNSEIDEVFIYYNNFVSTIKYVPVKFKLLPLTIEETKGDSNYIYEPSPDDVFDAIASGYVVNLLYEILLEASASEHSSRMTAMNSATENADKMIEELTMQYNRARQAIITNEISEIVGGTEALK